jgi:hypothetical protein
MTTGPFEGPTSAYPTVRTPASACFIEVKAVFPPGSPIVVFPDFVVADHAGADPRVRSWVLASDTAAAPKIRRRDWLMVIVGLTFVMVEFPYLELPNAGATAWEGGDSS